MTRLNDFLSFVGRIPLTLELTEAQNFLFALMRERFPGGGGPGRPRPEGPGPGQATGGLDGDRAIQPGALYEIVGVRRHVNAAGGYPPWSKSVVPQNRPIGSRHEISVTRGGSMSPDKRLAQTVHESIRLKSGFKPGLW